MLAPVVETAAIHVDLNMVFYIYAILAMLAAAASILHYRETLGRPLLLYTSQLKEQREVCVCVRARACAGAGAGAGAGACVRVCVCVCVRMRVCACAWLLKQARVVGVGVFVTVLSKALCMH